MLYSVSTLNSSTVSARGDFRDTVAHGPTWEGSAPSADHPDLQGCPPASSCSDVNHTLLSAPTGAAQRAPYLCGYCSRSFPRLSYLKRHEQGHADQLPFLCCFCGRHFKHKRSRDRHLKLHTGDKKYKCGLCDAAFSRSDHLKIHLKTHDSQKPHQCPVCCRGYSTAAALTAHMQAHKLTPASQHQQLSPHLQESRHSPSHSRHSPKSQAAVALHESQAVRDSRSFATLLRDSPGVSEAASGRLIGDGVGSEQRLENLSSELKKEATDQLGGNDGCGESEDDKDSTSRPSSSSPSLRCPLCSAAMRSSAHLQQHMSRHHAEMTVLSCAGDRPSSAGNRPSSAGTSSASSGGGLPSTTSTPSPRPPAVHSPRGAAARVHDTSALSAHSSVSASLLTSPTMMSALSPLSLGATALAHHQLLAFMGASKLSCCYCGQDGFSSLHALELHIHSMHGLLLNGEFQHDVSGSLQGGAPRPVSCELCGARLADVTALQRHVVTSHSFTDLLARTAEGVFCAQCLLPFSNPGALAEHIKLVHTTTSPAAMLIANGKLGKRPQSPADMPTDLSKKSKIETSSVMDLSATTLLCNQCNAPFNDFESFRNHLKTHLDSNLSPSSVCPECKLALPSDVSLENHLASHLLAVSTEYGCQACFKFFSKPDELQKHLMDIHAHQFYRCSLCKDVFDSKVSIQVHFAVKHSNECKVKKCTKCSVAFHSRSEFEQHVRSIHMRNDGPKSGAGYRCLLCHMTLATEAEFTAHLATHQKQFQCTQCDEAFHVEFLLDKHMQSQHNSEINGNLARTSRYNTSPSEDDLRCELCNISFPDETSIINHYQKIHGSKSGGLKIAAATVSLYCAYCNETCKSRADLEAHVKLHQSSGGRHKCNICDELCPSAATLAQHKLSHIKALSGSVVCSVCSSPLTSLREVSAHQSEHCSGPLPQPCIVCKQTMMTSLEIKAHANFHGSLGNSVMSYDEMFKTHSNTKDITNNNVDTNDIKKDTLKCPLCQIKLETLEEAENHSCSTKSNSALNEPLSSSRTPKSPPESVKTYQCIKCQESFPTESEVEAHVALHLQTEGSNHECHICRATFKSPLRLQCHLIEHTFEGCSSYTCYLCSAVFTVSNRLQQHMLDHGHNSKPYDCHHCRQRFFFKAELENHVLSHPDVAAGKCSECQAMVNTGSSGSKKQMVTDKVSRAALIVRESTVGGRSTASDRIDEREKDNATSEASSQSASEKENKAKPTNKSRTRRADFIPVSSRDDSESTEARKGEVTCSTCGRRCRSDASRALHELTHEGARPYLCGDCGAAFTRKCESTKHIKKNHLHVNTKIEDHSDEMKTTGQSHESQGNNLSQYATTRELKSGKESSGTSQTSGSVPLKCGSCSEEFTGTSQLRAHVESCHRSDHCVVVRSSSRCSSCSEGEDDEASASRP